MLQSWELRQQVQHGAFERAAARLDPELRARQEAERLERLERAAALATPAAAYNGPTRWRVKSPFIGLGLASSGSRSEFGHVDVKRECPGCGHRWLDRWRKDECPKCLKSLSLPQWQRNRRLPGEASTFKEHPASAMESESGSCRAGGAHFFRFGRCVKCGASEGAAITRAHASARRLQVASGDSGWYEM